MRLFIFYNSNQFASKYNAQRHPPCWQVLKIHFFHRLTSLVTRIDKQTFKQSAAAKTCKLSYLFRDKHTLQNVHKHPSFMWTFNKIHVLSKEHLFFDSSPNLISFKRFKRIVSGLVYLLTKLNYCWNSFSLICTNIKHAVKETCYDIKGEQLLEIVLFPCCGIKLRNFRIGFI